MLTKFRKARGECQARSTTAPSAQTEKIYPFRFFSLINRNIFSYHIQGCQIFLGTTYQNGEKYTK
jgi:hypothetical protein